MTKENIESNNAAENKDNIKGNKGWFIIYISVLTVAVAATGYYLWTDLNETKSALNRFSNDAGMSSAASEETISNLRNTLDQLSKEQELLSEKLSTLNLQQPLSNEDWALAEVEYLLVIATHHLILDRDVKTALAALEAAKQRLADLGNSQLDPLRDQIEKDINKLRNVEITDISGLANYLADLIERSDALPIKKTAISQEQNETSDLNAADKGWKNFPGLLWKELKNLVVIKRNNKQTQPLLLPQEEYFLYQNLRLELENARLAVLLADNKNFQVTIIMVIEWLNKYFDTNATEVSSMLESFEQMKTVDLGPELPDISSSLESLRAYSRSAENIQHDEEKMTGESVL